ncbi:MAG: aminotransferase class IV [Chloroflexota bacterium]
MNHLQLFALEDSGPVALPLPGEATSFDNLYDGLSLGVYSSLRTFDHNKFLYLEWHLARTRKSMKLLGWDFEWDELALRDGLHTVCSAYPGDEMRVRFDVLAAPAKPLGTESSVLIGLSPFTPPPQHLYDEGVSVAFAEGLSRENPLVKDAGFTQTRKVYPIGTPEAYERLLVEEDGAILEGTSSNFYAVRDGQIHTANEGILEGITRRILLEQMTKMSVSLSLTPISIHEVSSVEEAAISSSSRGLMPVVSIAGQPIGSSEPGPIFKELREMYNTFVAQTIRTAID